MLWNGLQRPSSFLSRERPRRLPSQGHSGARHCLLLHDAHINARHFVLSVWCRLPGTLATVPSISLYQAVWSPLTPSPTFLDSPDNFHENKVYVISMTPSIFVLQLSLDSLLRPPVSSIAPSRASVSTVNRCCVGGSLQQNLQNTRRLIYSTALILQPSNHCSLHAPINIKISV